MTTRPPAEIGMTPRRGRYPGADHRSRRVRAQSAAPADRIAGSRRAPAAARQDPQMRGHRAEADRTGRGRRVLPEGQRGRGDGLWRRQGRARHQRDRRQAETAPADGARRQRARSATCADDPAQVAALERGGRRGRDHAAVHVEVNMGGNRCGVEPGEPALDLARQIMDAPHLELRRAAGLSRLGAASAHLGGAAEGDRRRGREGRRRPATSWPRNGIACANITGAGTGTFEFEAGSGVYTELQCGSYIFMDADYGRNLDRDGGADPRLRAEPLRLGDGDEPPDRRARHRRCRAEGARHWIPARRPSGTSPPPSTSAPPTSTAGSASPRATNRLKLGDKIKLVPGHCDPTVNLYDWYVGVRGDRVEAIWPITARGAGY